MTRSNNCANVQVLAMHRLLCARLFRPKKEDDADQAQHLVSVPFTPANDSEARLKVLPLNSHLPQTAKRMKARTVLVTDVLTRDSETMRTLSLAVESMGIELAMTASVADLSGADLHFRNNPSMPVVTARLTQYSAITRILKRICDIVLSAIAIILSSPIMLWVAYKSNEKTAARCSIHKHALAFTASRLPCISSVPCVPMPTRSRPN